MDNNWYRRIKLRNYVYRCLPPLAVARERIKFIGVYLRRYETEGFGAPLPSILKHAIIRRVALQNHCVVLVETGTFLGDTPWHLRNRFVEIHTIEIGHELAVLAGNLFKGHSHIHVYEGNSGEVLTQIVPRLKLPTIFWLDGHYSGGLTSGAEVDCPILQELKTIFSQCKVPYTILIDDARAFGHDRGYPTLQTLLNFISKSSHKLDVSIENDIIFATPEKAEKST